MNIIKVKNEVSHNILYLYNTRIKTYADGSKHIKFYKFNIAKGNFFDIKSKTNSNDIELKYSRYKNLYKSKSNLIDLAYHNSLIKNWEYFITFTFNQKKINSFNYNIVSDILSKFLDNLKHQNKNMRYILVPELHKSGAIHFHGVFSNLDNIKLIPARNLKTNKFIYKNGLKIYNITNYKYGFTTASKIKNQEAVSVYISKYMTKNLIDLDFKKRYWASKNLERPKIEYAHLNLDNLSFNIKKDLQIDFESDKSILLSSYDI